MGQRNGKNERLKLASNKTKNKLLKCTNFSEQQMKNKKKTDEKMTVNKATQRCTF